MARLTRPEWRCYLAVSLDGFIARPDGSVDWLDAFDAGAAGFDDFLAGVDAIAMGRATFDAARAPGPWPYGERPTWVATSRPLGTDAPACARAASDLTAMAAAVEDGGFGRVWIAGGGRLLGGLAAIGRLDVLELWVAPVVIGAGIPLFAGGFPPRALTLLSCEPGPGGLARLLYAA